MPEASVSFKLDDGETLSIADEALRSVYETLWELAKVPGAVSTAALLMDARRLRPYHRKPMELTTPQSAVLRQAVALVHAPR